MASHQYKPANSPIRETEQEGRDIIDSDDLASSSSCFCFQWWNRGSYRNAHRPLLDGGGDGRRGWWVAVKERMMELREVSEVAAGPRWKTFIRRVGGYFGKNGRRQKGAFGYDAESYALNFDNEDEEDDDLFAYNARSARFVGPSLARSNEQSHGGL